MNRSRRKSFWLVLLLGAMPVAPTPLHAQDTAASLSPMTIKSPVDTFRELLAMTPEERKQAIADHWPKDQKPILAKIRQYESLKPEQRELRLRITELQWYLHALMTAPATDRAAQLALIPSDMRKLVEDRLRQWDSLKPDLQKELLANEPAMQLFLQEQQTSLPTDISPARRKQLEADVARVRAMPETQRRELIKRFNQFFDLTPREREKTLRTLRTLPDPDRQLMEKTLRAFEKLSDEQRAQCVQSFTNFAGMSLPERQQFLKNAERWRLMSSKERQTWREVVEKVPELPPVPPGVDNSALSRPPAPPGPPASAATNAQGR